MLGVKKKIFVGLSGGVDSSVSALLLLRAGYDVVGVFIKTWQPDFIPCTWESERLDAMRVAAQLNIPFLTCDASAAYRDDVAMYMVEEYRRGRTPNPDVMCNKYVKFNAFMLFARAHGADGIATGHYARIQERDGKWGLYRGRDTDKDQSYFLWTLTQNELMYTQFPIGNLRKAEVRRLAQQHNIHTHNKKDSQGICFLGQINMEEFLSHYIVPQKGAVVDQDGKVIGEHNGSCFYTLGQRHGFSIKHEGSLTKPWYVVAKDLINNTITVAHTILMRGNKEIRLQSIHSITGHLPGSSDVQFRYHGRLTHVELIESGLNEIILKTAVSIEAPSAGQSAVLYHSDMCLGGGIVA